tara:strand:+ start:128 stop:559 length:432 start_codon:yes stop_codon:yes gene_type:complete
MLTKKVKNRIIFLSLIFFVTCLLIFSIIKVLNKNLLYFRTPSDIKKIETDILGKNMRLGGMVKKDSIKIKNDNIEFVVTDFENEIIVVYSGTVPNLFLEEKGVIAEGKLKDKKYFIAQRILAKHDENYMPPALKETLDKKNVK